MQCHLSSSSFTTSLLKSQLRSKKLIKSKPLTACKTFQEVAPNKNQLRISWRFTNQMVKSFLMLWRLVGETGQIGQSKEYLPGRRMEPFFWLKVSVANKFSLPCLLNVFQGALNGLHDTWDSQTWQHGPYVGIAGSSIHPQIVINKIYNSHFQIFQQKPECNLSFGPPMHGGNVITKIPWVESEKPLRPWEGRWISSILVPGRYSCSPHRALDTSPSVQGMDETQRTVPLGIQKRERKTIENKRNLLNDDWHDSALASFCWWF